MNPLIGTNVSAIGFYEIGKVYANTLLGAPSLPQDGILAIVMSTAFGPFFVGGSIGDGGRARWWFGMGRIF
jgi:NTE family protein